MEALLGARDAALAHADAFAWERRVTPLSDERLMLVVPSAYVATVLLLRAALRGRTPPLGPLPALHNAVLTLWSAAMFAGTAHEAWRLSSAGAGAEWLLCLPPGTAVAGRLWWWSYVYYISKARRRSAAHATLAHAHVLVALTRHTLRCAQYYELLDTVLRVLKGQPLTFLHVFHHAVVLTMAYGVRSPRLTRTQPHPRAADAAAPAAQWLEFAQSLQVVALLTNTGIHVIMCACVAGAR
jgi:hypothetical protein